MMNKNETTDELKQKPCHCGDCHGEHDHNSDCECDEHNCECDEHNCECDEHNCDCEDCEVEEKHSEASCHCEDCDMENPSPKSKKEKGRFHTHKGGACCSECVEDDNANEEEGGVSNESNEVIYYLEMAQRIKADFDNYKKRNEEVAKASYSRGVWETVLKLLPVADSIDVAITKVADKNTQEGLKIVSEQIMAAFSKLDVKKVDALHKEFDPNFHEAVLTGSDENFAENVVIEQLQSGYMLGDKVLRHSVVKVNKL